MAITKIEFPSNTTPITNAEYTKQNLQIASLINVNNTRVLTEWSTNTIPKIKQGSIIRYADNLYIVDTSDYTIQGTAPSADGEYYIRISVLTTTTLKAEWITDISGYVWNESRNGWYSVDNLIINEYVNKLGAIYRNYIYTNVSDNKLNSSYDELLSKKSMRISMTTAGGHFVINTPDNDVYGLFSITRNNVAQWRFGKDNTASADFSLYRYNNTGAFQSIPPVISRTTGNISLNHDTSITGSLTVSKSGAGLQVLSSIINTSTADNAGVLQIIKSSSTNVNLSGIAGITLLKADGSSWDVGHDAGAYNNRFYIYDSSRVTTNAGRVFTIERGSGISNLYGTIRVTNNAVDGQIKINTTTDQYGLYTISKNDTAQWRFGKDNTASADFSIYRYNDSGVYQDSPLVISRTTGGLTTNSLISKQLQSTPSAGDALIIAKPTSGGLNRVGISSYWATFSSGADTGVRRVADILAKFSSPSWSTGPYLSFRVGYGGSNNNAGALSEQVATLDVAGNFNTTGSIIIDTPTNTSPLKIGNSIIGNTYNSINFNNGSDGDLIAIDGGGGTDKDMYFYAGNSGQFNWRIGNGTTNATYMTLANTGLSVTGRISGNINISSTAGTQNGDIWMV